MDLLYERGMMDVELARTRTLVRYDFSSDEDRYRDLVGVSPLRITALKIFGQNFTDPVISRADALRVLSEPRNRLLLEQGRVVILLDREVLQRRLAVPQKDTEYWTHYGEVAQRLIERVPNVDAADSHRGIVITVQDLRFVANEARLLPEEAARLDAIADSLRRFIGDAYTIRIDGHAADIGEPVGEARISRERAQTIMDAMVARGVPADLFEIYGHGAEDPLNDNATSAGRALNRRVEITATPRTVYVQRF
jgi:outer membrane protein OmpA-like peptidoglycan-associated protein